MEQWSSMGQWLSMGGYAPYVWPSVGIAVGAILLNLVAARRRHAEALRRARRRLVIESNGDQE